jgi:hypothetical protein
MKKIVFLIIFLYTFQFVYAQDIQIHRLNIKAYLNDKEIDSPVYENIYDVQLFGRGVHYLSSFVKLTSIFNLLGAEVKIDDKIIDIAGSNIGHIQFVCENEANVTMKSFNGTVPHITKSKDEDPSIMLIDSEFYIDVSIVRSLIDGRLRQTDNSVTLYTRDYERLDIPLTLHDCYLALDSLLSTDTKDNIKISSINNLVKYHMSLGMWLRNNWIRQSNNRIRKLFYDNKIPEPDD